MRQGLTYEKRAVKEIERLLGVSCPLLVGPWFRYTDDKDKFCWCQPDLIYARGSAAGPQTIVEIKLTWVEEAQKKLQLLYGPCVRALTGKKPRLLTVCKNLAPGSPEGISLEEALASRKSDLVAVWRP